MMRSLASSSTTAAGGGGTAAVAQKGNDKNFNKASSLKFSSSSSVLAMPTIPPTVVRIPQESQEGDRSHMDWMTEGLLCWFQRPLPDEFRANHGIQNDFAWWPALLLPSIAETQRRFVTQWSANKSIQRQWTMACLQEMCQRRNQPVAALLMNQREVELRLVPRSLSSGSSSSSATDDNDNDDRAAFLPPDRFLEDFTDCATTTQQAVDAMHQQQQVLQQGSSSSSLDWKEDYRQACEFVWNILSASAAASPVQPKKDFIMIASDQKAIATSNNNTAMTTTNTAKTTAVSVISPRTAASATSRSTAITTTTMAAQGRHPPNNNNKSNNNNHHARRVSTAHDEPTPTARPAAKSASSPASRTTLRADLFPSEQQEDKDNTKDDKQEDAAQQQTNTSHHASAPVPANTEQREEEEDEEEGEDENELTVEQLHHRANTDPQWVPKLDDPVEPHALWIEVWSVLEYSGWSCKLVTGPTGAAKNFYVKPYCRTEQSFPGVGYFTNSFDCQHFAKTHYGWRGPKDAAPAVARQSPHPQQQEEEESSDDESSESSDDDEEEEVDTIVENEEQRIEEVQRSSGDTVISGLTNPTAIRPHEELHDSPENRPRTKPQDPGKPLLSGGVSSVSSYDSNEHGLFKYLKMLGWDFKKGKGLIDYYYIKPGRSVQNGTPGIDYFTDKDEVEAYLRGDDHPNSNTQNRQKRKAALTKAADKAKKQRVSDPKQQSRQPKKQKVQQPQQQQPAKKRKQPISKTKTDSLASLAPSAAANSRASTVVAKGRSKKATKPKPKRVKRPQLLRVDEIKKLLPQIGIQHVNGGEWILNPPEGADMSGEDNDFKFASLTGLRKFLCMAGLPDEFRKNMARVLGKHQANRVERWINFANVPLTAEAAEEAIKQYTEPRNIERFLVVNHGITTIDGNYYLPKVDNYLPRTNRQRGKHYFPKEPIELFRQALRRWTVEQGRKDLALWAALADESVWQYDHEWACQFYPYFQNMPDEPWNTEEGDMSDSSDDSDGSSDSDTSMESDDKEGEAVNDSSDESKTSGSASDTSDNMSSASSEHEDAWRPPKATKKRRAKPSWQDQPKDSDVIPILKKLGFQRQHGKWGHPNASFMIKELDDLRKLIVYCGIPSSSSEAGRSKRSSRRSTAPNQDILKEKLDKEEHTLFWQWLVFTHFPKRVDDVVLARIHDLEEGLSDARLKQRLSSIKFELADTKYYPPGSDDLLRATNSKEYEMNQKKKQVMCYNVTRVQGLHVLHGKEALIQYLFSTPCVFVMPRLEQEYNDEGSQATVLMLRLWAILTALKREPMTLPEFSEESELYRFAQGVLSLSEPWSNATNDSTSRAESQHVVDLTTGHGAHVLEFSEESDWHQTK